MFTRYSAVDTHVAQHLLNKALTGELGLNRTRILVTHHVGLCISKANFVIGLEQGRIKFLGSPEDLHARGLLERAVQQQAEKTGNITDEPKLDHKVPEEEISRKPSSAVVCEVEHPTTAIPEKFVEDEAKEKGSIKFGVYWMYFQRSGGLLYWLPILAVFVGHQLLLLGRTWFVGIWTRSPSTESALFQIPSYFRHIGTHNVLDSLHQDQNLAYYLGIYLGLSVIVCMTGALRYFLIYKRSIQASKEMFEAMTFAVLRAPLRWLDTVPIGRILNRFTSDFELIDSRLATQVGALVYGVMQILTIVVAATFVSPWMLVIAAVLFLICMRIISWYIAGAREVKRLESIAKSPMFQLFGSTLTGLATIRTFDRTKTYIDNMLERIDVHSRAQRYIWLFYGWAAFRLDVVGAVFTMVVAAIVLSSDIDASLAGFAHSFALQYSSTVSLVIRFYANVELAMNSVERVSEYSRLAIEDQGNAMGSVPASWPSSGQLDVSELVVGYAPHLPSVLKGLTFSVARNERVGVVGRTGAGKSSLALALFRFLDARAGSILIDGVDIARIALPVLRSRLTIIPQDPVLFSGTIRSNLDVFNMYDDTELLDALRRVHLASSSHAQSLTLDTAIAESGLNLS